MSETGFNVRLDCDRKRKINIFTASAGITNKAFFEAIADNLEKIVKLLPLTGKAKGRKK